MANMIKFSKKKIKTKNRNKKNKINHNYNTINLTKAEYQWTPWPGFIDD